MRKDAAMKRERVIKAIFVVVLVMTTIVMLLAYFGVYTDMVNDEHADDIMVKLPAAFMWLFFIIIFTPIYLAEIDLYYNIRYFCKDKSEWKNIDTIFHAIAIVLSLWILLSILFMFLVPNDSYLTIMNVWKLCFLNYVVLKVFRQCAKRFVKYLSFCQ